MVEIELMIKDIYKKLLEQDKRFKKQEKKIEKLGESIRRLRV